MARLIATWFGCGYSPRVPGTVGSAAALALAIPFHLFAGWSGGAFALLALAWVIPAVWAAHGIEASIGKKDPSIVVIDEVVGQWLALAGVVNHNWMSWCGAFVVFRLFDIWKPPPARQLERLRGGFGIVADDVVAGLYAALVLHLAGRLNLY